MSTPISFHRRDVHWIRGVLASTDRIGILQRAMTETRRRFPEANGVIKT